MAKRFRLESLPKDQQDQFRIFADQYFPQALKEQFIDSIEKTGTISDDLFKQGNFSDASKAQVLGQLTPLLTGLPSGKEAYQKFIDATPLTKEADLTDQELQDRIEAYQGRGSIPADPTEAVEKIKGEILSVFNSDRTQRIAVDPNRESIARQLADAVYAGEDVSNALLRITRGTPNRYKATILQLQNKLPKLVSDLRSMKLDTSEDVTRIQDILNTRGIVKRKGEEEGRFLAETPAELAKLRGGFLAEREAGAQRFLAERFGPRAIAQLNVSGLAEGPDIASVMASQAGRMQGDIESTLRQIEFDDNAFFAEAAFRLNTAKLNQSEFDFRASVEAERTGIRTGQFNRFKSSESDIQRDFELAMLERESQRNLDLQRSGLQMGKDTAASDLRTGLITSTAQSTAEVVAGKITYGGNKDKNQPSPSFNRIG